MTAYVALLRAINVGGNSIIRMPDLTACVAGLGFRDVTTYIASGNVLLDAGSRPEEATIEAALEARFAIPIPVVLRSLDEMRAIVAAAPPDHGAEDRRSDVMFLKAPLTAEEAYEALPPLREGVDAVAIGPGVLYFSRLTALASKTRMTQIMALPIYKQMTIRTWRTVTKVAELLEWRA